MLDHRDRYDVAGARWGARHGSVVVYLTDEDGTRWACVAHIVGHAYPDSSTAQDNRIETQCPPATPAPPAERATARRSPPPPPVPPVHSPDGASTS